MMSVAWKTGSGELASSSKTSGLISGPRSRSSRRSACRPSSAVSGSFSSSSISPAEMPSNSSLTVATSSNRPVSTSPVTDFSISAIRASRARRSQRLHCRQFCTSGFAQMLSRMKAVMLPELPPATQVIAPYSSTWRASEP